jgi:hypothetical protein
VLAGHSLAIGNHSHYYQLIDSRKKAMFKTFTHRAATVALALLLTAFGALAADALEILLTIKNNRFEPAEVKVPANQRVKLIVHNQDPSPEEFESRQLGREKIVPAERRFRSSSGHSSPGAMSSGASTTTRPPRASSSSSSRDLTCLPPR